MRATRGRIAGGVVLVAASALFALTPASAQLQHRSTSQRWKLQAQWSPNFSAPYAIACSGAATCYVAGSGPGWATRLDVTTDGGGQFRPVALPPGVKFGLSTGDIACPSTTECLVGAERHRAPVILSTDSGGGFWATTHLPDGVAPHDADVLALKCLTTELCFAGLEVPEKQNTVNLLLRSTDGGQHWTRAWSSLNPGTIGPFAIACPWAGLCIAAVPGVRGMKLGISHNSGLSWTSVNVRRMDYPTSIVCHSSRMCFVAGLNTEGIPSILATTNGARTWHAAAMPSIHGNMDAAACNPDGDCLALDTSDDDAPVVLASSNTSTSWAIATTPDVTTLSAVACMTSGSCLAVGMTRAPGGVADDAAVTSGLGASWTVSHPPGGLGAVTSVSCPSATDCVATASKNITNQGNIEATQDSGADWTGYGDVPPTQLPREIACPSASRCVEVGSRVFRTRSIYVSDGPEEAPAEWKAAEVPKFLPGVAELSCGDPEACSGLERGGSRRPPELLYSSDDGSTWKFSGYTTRTTLREVACSSASTLCIAAGSTTVQGSPAVLVSGDAGATFSAAAANPPGVAGVTAAACSGSSTCLVAGRDASNPSIAAIASTSDSGAIWTTVDELSIKRVLAIDCPSTLDCIAVGTAPGILDEAVSSITYTGGASWGTTGVPIAAELDTVNCWATWHCEAGGSDAAGGAVTLRLG